MGFPFPPLRRGVARLAEAVLKRADPTARATLEATRFGTASDDDELDGRQLHGTNQLEFTEAHRTRAVQLSRKLFYRSGLYGSLTEMFGAMVVGDGVVLKHRDEGADKFLQGVLELNRFHERLPDFTDRWFVDGELPWTVLVPYREPWDAKTATSPPKLAGNATMLGRVDTLEVTEVKVRAFDRDQVVSVKVQPLDGADFAARVPGDVAVAINGVRPTDVDGTMAAALCLWRINPLGVRGAPLLLRILDKGDSLDRVVAGIVNRQEVASEFAWLAHYTSEAGKVDEAQEKKILGWLQGRRPGKSLVRPMKDGKPTLDLEAVAPDLKAGDSATSYETTLGYLLGSVSVPRMWFGAGGDTNRATAVEQGAPIHRRLKKLSAQYRQALRDLATYIVYVGQLSGDVAESVDPSDVEVTTADVATRDSVRDVQEVSEMALMVRDLEERRAITSDEGRRMLRRSAMSKPFGECLEGGDLPEEQAATGAPPAGSSSADAVDADPATGAGMPAGGAGGPVAPGAATSVQDTALNGAQIQAAASIVQSVVDGTLPEESAVGLLIASFPTWTRERALAIIHPAAEFEPKVDPPASPPNGPPPPPPPKADPGASGDAQGAQDAEDPEDPPEPPADGGKPPAGS